MVRARDVEQRAQVVVRVAVLRVRRAAGARQRGARAAGAPADRALLQRAQDQGTSPPSLAASRFRPSLSLTIAHYPSQTTVLFHERTCCRILIKLHSLRYFIE